MRVKDVRGFEGLYLVTDDGNIIRVYRTKVNAAGSFTMWESRMLVCPRDGNGRRHVRMFAPDGRYRHAKVYQIVAEAFCPPYRGDLVNHIDGDPANDRASNLEWCDQQANLLHGRLRKQNVQLTATQIMEIRALKDTVPLKTLCDRYNIDRATAQRIRWGAKRKPRG